MIRILFLAWLAGGSAALLQPPHHRPSPLRAFLSSATNAASSVDNTDTVLDDVDRASTKDDDEVNKHDASPNEHDDAFHDWCTNTAGILTPKAKVLTTSLSVAGRGVFATSPLHQGEVVISIPYRAAMTRETGAAYFPALAEEMRTCREEAMRSSLRKRSRLRNFVDSKILRREEGRRALPSGGEVAEAELTAYALAALETAGGGVGEHPWALWVSQWTRDDPFQWLIDDASWKRDPNSAIDKAVSQFQNMAPTIPEYKLRAALGLRLDEMERYRSIFSGASNKYGRKRGNRAIPVSESLHSILTSRYIRFSDNAAVMLPLHDMINHSTHDANLSFEFTEDGRFDFIARRDIDKDEELFLCYTEDDRGVLEENRATWRLVQWGIPPASEDSLREEEE